MEEDDIAQSAEIERDAFPSMFPYTAFRQELNKKLARYLVAWRSDDPRAVGRPDEGSPLLHRLMEGSARCPATQVFRLDTRPAIHRRLPGPVVYGRRRSHCLSRRPTRLPCPGDRRVSAGPRRFARRCGIVRTPSHWRFGPPTTLRATCTPNMGSRTAACAEHTTVTTAKTRS